MFKPQLLNLALELCKTISCSKVLKEARRGHRLRFFLVLNKYFCYHYEWLSSAIMKATYLDVIKSLNWFCLGDIYSWLLEIAS